MAHISKEDATKKFLRSAELTIHMFQSNVLDPIPIHLPSHKAKVTTKVVTEFAHIAEHPKNVAVAAKKAAEYSVPLPGSNVSSAPQLLIEDMSAPPPPAKTNGAVKVKAATTNAQTATQSVVAELDAPTKRRKVNASTALIVRTKTQEHLKSALPKAQTKAIALRKASSKVPKPTWHAPWKCMRVISGHLGWVRCAAMNPTNDWFATGSADRTVKLWDLASGRLKLTLTGHIHTVRAMEVSDRHPYLFSAGEDKMVKCWDLEYNRVCRHYHGHLSGVYALSLHPKLPLLVTGGRDAVGRVWDMRTKNEVMVLGGHQNTVCSILTQGPDPQVVTSSEDNKVKLWDLRKGKATATLTNHKKGVRALVMHKREFTFASASSDNIKKWLLPKGKFLRNFSGHNTVVNCMALNDDDVLFSGGNDGTIQFRDWKSGYCFQKEHSVVQPGSLDSEAGIFGAVFDKSSSRLITCEADKTIKMWKEDEEATPETHPIDMRAWTAMCRKRKRY